VRTYIYPTGRTIPATSRYNATLRTDRSVRKYSGIRFRKEFLTQISMPVARMLQATFVDLVDEPA
jgi:hypothetical protein